MDTELTISDTDADDGEGGIKLVPQNEEGEESRGGGIGETAGASK